MKERVISGMLRRLADVIDRGQCGMDDEEIEAMAQLLTHRKVSIEQAAQYLNISRPTLYRRIAEGKIPEPRKEPGGKEYFWLDELEKDNSPAKDGRMTTDNRRTGDEIAGNCKPGTVKDKKN